MIKQITSIIVIMLLLLSINVSAQNNFWTNSNASEFNSTLKERVSKASKYRTISLNTEAFLDFASQARGRFSEMGANPLLITLPLPNGENETFTLEDSELMDPELAEKFPQLKTFSGKGITDRTASLRITYSPYFGLSAMILSGEHSTVYIDPITADNKHYMSYFRNDLTQTEIDFRCTTEEEIMESVDTNGFSQRAPSLGDCNLRRYRLAQSCNGEYAQYHIGQAGGTTGTTAGDKAIVQAAMNVTMNRVNGVFERDLGITLQIVGNNDLIIYLDAATDPWTNEFNTTTAQTIDAQIGVTNYDIGHNFNTTGGGSAGCLDCVCLSTSQSGQHKGRGYTGRAAPIGDPFDIDYVAHEMGHQFGGYHVQSNQSCRSGSGATEVETGSGSSIMGYAGICSANVQNQSDDYFAYVNIRDIVTSINFGNASGCAELIMSGNTGPQANAGSDYSIPASTPFRLEGTGSDPNDSGLTYCWEQNDPENPGSNSAPTSTRTQGPMFRSIAPVAVPYRYFPNLTAIVNNTTPTFEVLPSISRAMDFSFIVRDNNSVSGCTASDLMTVTTVASAGPFVVTSPNTNVTWNAGTLQDVTWDVANTTAAPVSCSNVDIFLSTDGGNTYPITLATGVANNGTYSIVVPNNQGTQNRIMVKASNNIFFDISDTNFTIGVPVVCNANVPTGLAASNVASTSATLSWDEVSGAAYDLRYREVGSPTWTTISVAALSSNVTGLNAVTNYEAQVRSKCNGGAISAYSSTVLFTTTVIPPCSGTQITTFPYTETFDSGIGDWTQATGDDGDWTLNAGSTPSSGTGPSDDITVGGNYFYTEASTGGLDANATVVLISPCFDLTTVTTGTFSFYYHMFGNNVGSLNLEVTIDDGANWTNLFSESGDKGNIWNAQNIDISGYYGEVVKFRFMGLTGNGWSSDIAIDQISIGNPITPDYCASSGNTTYDTGVTRVIFGTIDNADGSPKDVGYEDFSSISTDVLQGNNVDLTVHIDTDGNYTIHVFAWIDWNQDADFDDIGEAYDLGSITNVSDGALPTLSITIPESMNFGNTRMRVSARYNSDPTPCLNNFDGEVEDYNVNVKYDGLLYSGSTWEPNAPSGLTTTDNALVLDGIYTVNSDVILNDLIVNDIATIEVSEGESIELNGSLENNGIVTLNSTSLQYSSLIVNGTVTGDVIYKRHINTNTAGNDLIAPPVYGQQFNLFKLANSNIVTNSANTLSLFGPFEKVNNTFVTYSNGETATLNAGIGYRAASTDNGTFTFTGSVETGNVASAVLISGPSHPEWNLIGNPYPSYIKLSDFLLLNNSKFNTERSGIYGYDGDSSNGWSIWNQAYSDANLDAKITPGQGFLVATNATGIDFNFTPTMRVAGNSDDFIVGRDSNTVNISHLQLQLSSASDAYKTDFYITDNATLGHDPYYDSEVFGATSSFALYSDLVEQSTGKAIGVQSIGNTELTEVIIPLGVNVLSGEQVVFSISETTLDENISIYLEDRHTNTFTLLNTSNYTITSDVDLLGTGRFYLRFSQGTLSLNDSNFEGVEIFNVNASNIITIRGLLNLDSQFTIYDLQGRLIKTELLKANSNLNYIKAPNLSTGVYMVKLKNELQAKTQKIIIK